MTIFMTIYVSILGQQKIRNFLTYGLLIREKIRRSHKGVESVIQ